MTISITPLSESELEAAVPFIQKIMEAGDTYALPRTMTAVDISAYFFSEGNLQFKAELDGKIIGVYLLRANQKGGGEHVANAGFMVADFARGKGVARAMANHALKTALELGFKAMQFNFVVSVNEIAVNLWKSLGFNVIGTIPKGFNHPAKGMVDVFVMHKFL